MLAVLALRVPARYRRLDAATEVAVAVMNRRPCLAFASHLEVKKLAEVVTKSTDECGVLPARAIAGTAETVNAAVRSRLHNDVALELFQGLERHLQGMPV